MKKLAQGFNTAAQDSNPGPLSRESDALSLSHGAHISVHKTSSMHTYLVILSHRALIFFSPCNMLTFSNIDGNTINYRLRSLTTKTRTCVSLSLIFR